MPPPQPDPPELPELPELPGGTVTLLFADLDGPTALLTALGAEAYARVLSEQRAIVGAAAQAHGGHEMETEGESAFVVFASATGALAAAVAVQRGTSTHDWPAGARVRVRVGVHTGEPDRHEGGYIGLPVHHAARVCAAANGGQVLVGPATWALAGDALPEGVGAVDVGEHRLKDVPGAMRLHRLVVPGVPDVPDPPRGLGTTARLPRPANPLVAREAELSRLAGYLSRADDPTRLLTLVGPGGVGKTRLAVAAAEAAAPRFPGGVHFVDLSAVSSVPAAWERVAEALAVGTPDAGGAPADVTGFVAGRQCLLVLDNLEQLADADRLVAALVDASAAADSRSVVLVTSRQPVRLQAEQVLPVEPLADDAAAALFLQHAHRVRPRLTLTEADREAVAQVCRALDGLPLALEIAAARLRLLSPRRLLADLGGGLSLTARESDRPQRQRTLRDTVDWSYQLLDPPARRLLRALAVAPGGADLTTVEVLPGPAADDDPMSDPFELVAVLVDTSLARLVDGADGEPRVHLLRLVRQFADDTLRAAGEAEQVAARLTERMADVAEELRGQLRGAGQVRALDRWEAERDNLEAALEWSLGPDRSDLVPQGLRIVLALGSFWQHHGRAAEARRWLERAVEVAADDPGQRAAALEALQGLAGILMRQGEAAAALEAIDQCTAAWRQLGRDDMLAGALAGRGLVLRVLGRTGAAREALVESVAVARRVGVPARLAGSLTDLGILETDAGDPDRAASLFDEAIAVEEAVGDVWGPAVGRANLAAALVDAGRPDEALAALGRVVAVLDQVDDAELEIVVLEGYATALVAVGADEEGARAAGTAERLRDDAGLPVAERDQAQLDELLAPGRARLGEVGWAAAVAAGRQVDRAGALAGLVVLAALAAAQPRRR